MQSTITQANELIQQTPVGAMVRIEGESIMRTVNGSAWSSIGKLYRPDDPSPKIIAQDALQRLYRSIDPTGPGNLLDDISEALRMTSPFTYGSIA